MNLARHLVPPQAGDWALLVQTGPFETQSAPFGLGMVAAGLRTAGVEPISIDEAVDADPVGLTDAVLAELRPPVLIGLSAKTPGFTKLIEVARRVRRDYPGVPIVVGGAHATSLPELSLDETGADVIALGECDETIVDLVAWARGDMQLGDVAGVLYEEGGEKRTTPRRPAPDDLDALPRPVWERIGGFERYSATPWQVLRKGTRVAPLLTTRGCPFECTFCAAQHLNGRKLRKRSPESLVDEIRWLRTDFGVDELHIIDDVFNVNMNHAKGVCEAIVRAGLDMPIKTPNGIRADCVDDELVALMKRAGVWQVGFGVETADEGVLDLTKKRLDLGVLQGSIDRFHAAGISVFGYFILGLPGDDGASCARSLKRMRSLPLDHVHVSYCVPYPGTEVFEKGGGVERFGADWERYLHYVPFPTSALSAKELRAHMRRGLIGFYSRLRRAAQLARDAFLVGPAKLARLGGKYAGVTP